MKSQLSAIVTQLEHAMSRLEKLADVIPDQAWSEHSDPAQWSVAECVAHLNLTSEAYIPRLRTAVGEARNISVQMTKRYHLDAKGWLFSKMIGPLPALGRMRIGRVKTTADFIPSGQHPKHVTLADFKRDQDQLIALIHEADGLPLDKVWITSPFGGKIRYNCYSALVILPRHQERHLDQATLVWGKSGDA